MKDVYEVDNRYPEVAEPYEKIRGGRHHGGLNSARELAAAKRTSRFNSLKRGFWVSAAAVATVLTVLFASPEAAPQAVEPEPLREPVLSFVSAAQREDRAEELEYEYRVEVKDAGGVTVMVAARTEEGELLAEAGPFSHTQTENSGTQIIRLSRTENLSRVKLELTGVYTLGGEEGRSQTTRLVALRGVQPETAPEPPPETVMGEPETKPTETEPFVAPTLTIRGAALNGAKGETLQYSYQITPNSAQRLTVWAEITAGDGASVGRDGPYVHTSESSPVRTAALTWAKRPAAVTLTLTATYLEDGEEKTLTASQTVQVPEENLDAPTLTITEAAINGTEVTPLSYRYEVNLNSAEKLEVSAVVTARNGERLGTDGPYSHEASESSPARSMDLSWYARPTSVTLTLTGTYMEKGEKKTVTAQQTLEVPELPFVAPTIRITSARCDDMLSNLVVYSAVIEANSADPLTVNVSVSAEGTTFGTDGPIYVTGYQTITERTVRLSGEEDDMVLTLTGTYVEKGVTKTIRASMEIEEAEPFEWPEIELFDTERGPGDLVRYQYYVVLNSVPNLKIRAQFLDDSDHLVYETGPMDVWSDGVFGVYSVHTGRRASSIRLIGEFVHLGKTYTVDGSDGIPNAVTYIEPEVEILSASTTDFLGGSPAKLSFSFRVTMGDADQLPLRLTVITDSGVDISPAWNQTFTSDGTYNVTVPLDVPAGETGMYMMLGGYYTIEGEEHSIIDMETVTVPNANLRPLASDGVLFTRTHAILFQR